MADVSPQQVVGDDQAFGPPAQPGAAPAGPAAPTAPPQPKPAPPTIPGTPQEKAQWAAENYSGKAPPAAGLSVDPADYPAYDPTTPQPRYQGASGDRYSWNGQGWTKVPPGFFNAVASGTALQKPSPTPPPQPPPGPAAPVVMGSKPQPASGPPPQPGEVGDTEAFGPSPQNPAPLPKVDPTSPVLAQARAAEAKTPAQIGAIENGALYGFEPDLKAGGAYVGQAIANAIAQAKGQPAGASPGEVFQAVGQAAREANQQFGQQHPVQNFVAGAAGGLLNPATYAGGEYVAGAKTLGGAMARGAGVGILQGAAQGAGAGQTLSQRVGNAVKGGAIGGTLGAAAPVVGGAIGTLAKFAKGSVDEGVQLAHQALKNAGIDPDALPQAAHDAIAKGVKAGQHPTDVAFKAVAEHGLPKPVPMSKGQMSGEPGQQFQENAAATGAKGPGAAQAAKGFRQSQQEALAASAEEVSKGLGGGRIAERGEAGARISNRANAAWDRANAKVGAAYDAARNAGHTALPPEHAGDLIDKVRGAVGENYTLANVKPVRNELEEIERQFGLAKGRQAIEPGQATPKQLPAGFRKENWDVLSEQAKQKYLEATGMAAKGASKVGPGEGGEASARNIFAGRQRLTKLTQSSDPVVAGAARAAVKALDQGVSDALHNDLFTGNEHAINQWRQAIAKRAEFGRMFEGDDLVERLTERADRNGLSNQLKLDPTEASNYILGREQLDKLGQANLARDLQSLQAKLGPNSPEWKALRSETFERLMTKSQGPSEAGNQAGISGSNLLKNWRSMQDKHGEVINGMFTKAEQDQITRLGVIAERVTKPVAGAMPVGGDLGIARIAHAMSAMPGHLMGQIPLLGAVAKHVGSVIADRQAQMKIVNATTNATPRKLAQPGGGIVGSLAGVTASNQGTRSISDYYKGP